ncbi:MAG: sugar phosphate isomerase/epimerase [Oscillospiraceae bacterium]|nr:sugar phosphate isomerase/epimerase [Oscillospiraceae bacterium]
MTAKIGIATASLFPLHTETALLQVAKLGVKNVEIFLNSPSELVGEVFMSMQDTIRDYNLNIMALHPFSSPMETLYLFSAYDRRVTEILDLYERYFAAMERLGARIFVIHGAFTTAKCSDALYIERVSLLTETARRHGVTVAQENVCYCKSGALDFLCMMKTALGDSAAFVLDLKQVRRVGGNPLDYVDALGDSIIHLHLSDCTADDDCVRIGKGEYDFLTLFKRLEQSGFSGGGVVELYRENYGEYSELRESVEFLENLLKNA